MGLAGMASAFMLVARPRLKGTPENPRQSRGRNPGVRWQSEERAPTPPSEAMWDRLPACQRAHGQAGSLSHTCPPAVPSKGGVALTLPAALQGAARVSGSRLKSAGFRTPRVCHANPRFSKPSAANGARYWGAKGDSPGFGLCGWGFALGSPGAGGRTLGFG